MPDMFGFSGGFIQGQQAADAHTLAGLQAADTASVIQARGLGMQEEGIKIEQAKLALQNQKMFQQRLAARMNSTSPGQPGGDPTDPATVTHSLASDLNDMASLAMDSGLVEQGKDYAVAASTLVKNQAAVDKIAFDQGMKNLNLINKLIPSIHDEASWKQANMIFQMESGHQSPFANHPYSPELVEQLKHATQTSLQSAQQKAAEARARADDARAKEADIRTTKLIPSQLKINEDRDAALRKAGASAQIPKAAEIKLITDLGVSTYGGAGKGNIDPTDPQAMADLRIQARPIAERMNQIMKEHPGMSQTEAAKKAFTEAQKRGDFAGLERNPKLPGASAKTAVPLPTDKTKIKDNHWYTVNGKPMYLDGGRLYTQEEIKANESDAETEDDSEDDEE